MTAVTKSGKINLTFSANSNGTLKNNLPMARIYVVGRGWSDWFGDDNIHCGARCAGFSRLDEGIVAAGGPQEFLLTDATLLAQISGERTAPAVFTVTPHGSVNVAPGASYTALSVAGELGHNYWGFSLKEYHQSLGGDPVVYRSWLQRKIYLNNTTGLPARYLYYTHEFTEDRIGETETSEEWIYDLEGLGNIVFDFDYDLDRDLRTGAYRTNASSVKLSCGLDVLEPDMTGLFWPVPVQASGRYTIDMDVTGAIGTPTVDVAYSMPAVWMWGSAVTAKGYYIS